MNTDAFSAVFPGPRVAGQVPLVPPGHGTHTRDALTDAKLIQVIRAVLPEVGAAADREARRQSQSPTLSGRPATWSLAALVLRGHTGAANPEHTASIPDGVWRAVGLPRAPGRAEAQRYLAAARRAPLLNTRSARALWSVLPALAASGQMPGGYVDGGGFRRVLSSNPPAQRTHRRRGR